MTTVLYLASVIALWGVLSLILDREVIDYPDAGPLLGPAIAAVACVVTGIGVARGRGPSTAIACLIGSYAAMLAVGALGYTITRGSPIWMALAAAHLAISPFVLGAAVLSALVVLGATVVRRVR